VVLVVEEFLLLVLLEENAVERKNRSHRGTG